MLRDFAGKPLQVFVVWEPVLLTDWSSPSTRTLNRLSDSRAAQFWDRRRLISHSMRGENRRGVVWDHIAVYPPGVVWGERPPEPLYEGGPVVQVIGQANAAVARALR